MTTFTLVVSTICILFSMTDIAGQQFGLGGVSSAGQRDSNFGSNSRQGQRDNFSNDFQPVEYRPFGSTRPCSSLINDALMLNGSQTIIEQILLSADLMGNSFSGSSSINNEQLDAWTNQACGLLQNLIGYLRVSCQYATQSSPNLNQDDVTAQFKLRAMYAAKDYICSNNEINLKELAINNAAQCVRRSNQPDFGCSRSSGNQFSGNQFGGSSFSQSSTPYASLIILSAPNYNSDNCRMISDKINCISDKYVRGSDFCSSRAANHLSRIMSAMIQAVQCGDQGSFQQGNLNNQQGNNNLPQAGNFPVTTNGNPQRGSGFSSSSSNNFNSFQASNNFPQQSNLGQASSTFSFSSPGTATTIPPWNKFKKNSSDNEQITLATLGTLLLITWLL